MTSAAQPHYKPQGSLMTEEEKAVARESGTPQLTIAVVGMPGQGKSTVLNTLFKAVLPDDDSDDDSDDGEPRMAKAPSQLFVSGAAGESCTKESKEAWVRLDFGHGANPKELILILIDTPGFPDPDPTQAALFFDDVAGVVNREHGLHALIWVVKQDRVIEELTAKYKILMREFKLISCEMIMVLNGFENFSDASAKSLTKKRTKARTELEGYANTILTSVDLQDKVGSDSSLIISTDKAWLAENLLRSLLAVILDVKPQESHMRTVRQVVEKCSSGAALLQATKEDVKSRIEHLNEELAELKSSTGKKGLASLGTTVGVVALAILLPLSIPAVVGSAIAAGTASAALGTAEQVKIARKKRELKALQDELGESQEETDKKIATMQEEFEAFAKQFGGVDFLKHTYLTTTADVMDKNNDGEISREEWATAFDELDVDKDGCISRMEWYLKQGQTDMFQKINGERITAPVLTRMQWMKYFDTVDVNGAGTIPRDQFELTPQAAA